MNQEHRQTHAGVLGRGVFSARQEPGADGDTPLRPKQPRGKRRTHVR